MLQDMKAFKPLKSRARLSRGELRRQCEDVRLELRALYRSLDRLKLLVEAPRELLALAELDADLAEALWVLDQPKGQFDQAAMVRDTTRSLERIPAARDRVLGLLSDEVREDLLFNMSAIRASLAPEEAYLEVPGRDPLAG